MSELHEMIVRLDMRMESIEDKVVQRISNALGGFLSLVEEAFDSVDAHCLTLKLELEARLRADVRAQLADLDAKLDRGAKLCAFPSCWRCCERQSSGAPTRSLRTSTQPPCSCAALTSCGWT